MATLTIISLGWIANLFVHFYIHLTRKTNSWVTLKPFSCQECMGFWIGLTYGILKHENLLIFAGLSSLSAVLISLIINRFNAY